MKPVRLILSLFAVLLFVSCDPDDGNDGPKASHEEYFPVQPGSWRIYQVDSIARPTNVNDIDTAQYQVREVIDSAFIDGAGNRMYRILRYRRNTDHEAWVLREVASAGIAGGEAVQQEGNSRYVKLVFPVKKDRTWNANVYNSEDAEGYYRSRYVNAHVPFTDTFGNTFDSTVLVELNNEKTAINSDYWIERYAAGVGLVEFRHDSVTTQGKSFWFRKRIVSFGR